MPFRRSVTLLVVLGVLAFTTACGSRLSDEERALATAGAGQGSGGVTDGSAITDDGGVADPGSGTTGGDTTGGSGGDTTGGTTTGGSTGGVAVVGGSCQAGNATSTGVTKEKIKVGNVSQITGLVPGFGQTSVAGVRAYFAMINNQGGVCGRQLELVTADDAFQSSRNRNETEKLADQVIAFVGNLSVVDDGGAPVVDSKGIADVSLATTPPRIAAKNNYSPNPQDPTPGAGNGAHTVMKYFDDTQGVGSTAIFYQDAAVSSSQVPAAEIAMKKAGLPAPEKYAVSPTATNFRSEATDMKNKKIDLVYTIAEINAIANLARAFGDVGYQPKVPYYGAQTYGQKIIQLAGKAAEGTEIGLIFAVPEESGSVKGMADFNTWYKRTAGGADADFFAVVAWAAAAMFVEALAKAGPDPTQEKVIAQLKTFTAWTGGGIVAPINPAGKAQPKCFQILEVRGGKWVKQHPAKGFAC